MRNLWIRLIAGITSFFLPALACIVGMRLDQSSFRHDPIYRALVPVVMLGSVLLAAVVPAAFILRSGWSLSRRIGLTAATWCLLALECGLAAYVVLMEGLR